MPRPTRGETEAPFDLGDDRFGALRIAMDQQPARALGNPETHDQDHEPQHRPVRNATRHPKAGSMIKLAIPDT
jgi:hypothetical protein